MRLIPTESKLQMRYKPGIIQFWDSEEIPEYLCPLLSSIADLNPSLRRDLFSKRKAENFIAENFGRRQVEAFNACAVPAMQADYFRYCAVYVLGGIYVDVDFTGRAPLGPLLEGPAGATLFGRPELPPNWRAPAYEWGERVGEYRVIMNSFFAFKDREHPLLELTTEVATSNVENRVAEDVALVTGPAVFTALYQMKELGSFDAFLDHHTGSPVGLFARRMCEAIGEYERVSAAFEGVRILPEVEARYWLGPSQEPLPYKSTEAHWPNVTTSIYR